MNSLDQPRVIIFPMPLQGHITSMLNLARLLHLSGLHVTFLNTDHAHNRLLHHGAADVNDRPGFVFRTIPDGLPEDHPRSADRVADIVRSIEITVKESMKPILESETVTCIIADGIFGGFMVEVCNGIGVPVILFRTASASYFWACYCIHDTIQSGQLLLTDEEDMDKLITSVDGMESFLRYRDLPRFPQNSTLQRMAHVSRQSSRAAGLILNTFEDLEGPIVSHIRAHCNPKTYAVGPLHAHLKERLSTNSDFCRSTHSLFEVDRACLAWLDSQPLNYVIYVCFGSLAVLTKEQLIEFWHGLVNSEKRFLWAIRPEVLNNGGPLPLELSEGTKERGLIARWVPQEEVLAHRAVAGFMTHSGWNSTLESIVCGVPMICWPCFGDQQINSRYVGEVWKLGIDMKDVCDQKIVTKMVNDLIVDRRDELAGSTAGMAELAKKSVSEGGSSYYNLNSLIEDIKMISK